jgi:hypothetical protein
MLGCDAVIIAADPVSGDPDPGPVHQRRGGVAAGRRGGVQRRRNHPGPRRRAGTRRTDLTISASSTGSAAITYPWASRLTPVSASPVCDDPCLIDVAEQLLGGPVIPECPAGILYFFEAGWHTDDGTGVRGVKFAAYQVCIPGYVADTSPGDVIAFDLHTWHASTGGRDRLAWAAVYQRWPETAAERDRALRSVHDRFEQAFRGFDRDRYPVWRDWLGGAGAYPRRAPVIARMRQAGVPDLPGALVTGCGRVPVVAVAG